MTRTVGSANHDVVYFLHGGGESHKAWIRKEGWQFVRRRWAERDVGAPIVVSISFGGFWLLAERNASPASGLFETFTQSVLPYVERELLGNEVGVRRLLGFSMGGYNAGLLVMKRPGTFAAAALVSPSIVPVDSSGFERTDPLAHFQWMLSLGSITNEFYPDDRSRAEDALIGLCDRLLVPAAPRVLISTGRRDALFYDGSRELVERARDLNVPLTWLPHEGAHNAMLPDEIADFLVE